jgi:hypothetical protein
MGKSFKRHLLAVGLAVTALASVAVPAAVQAANPEIHFGEGGLGYLFFTPPALAFPSTCMEVFRVTRALVDLHMHLPTQYPAPWIWLQVI